MTSQFHEETQVLCIPMPHPFPVAPVNVYVHLGDEVTLFDAGANTDEGWETLLAGLADAGLTVGDIDKILLTHHHLDHIGLSRRVRDASGAAIVAHPSVRTNIHYMFDETTTRPHLEHILKELGAPPSLREEIIDQRLLFRHLLDDFVVDEVVEDNGMVGEFEVFFRPGHAATDVVFAHRKRRWAVTGDHLIPKVTPNPILRRCPESGEREKCLVQYCDSVKKTRENDLGWCFPGHGAPFEDHRETVDATLAHIAKRNEKVLRALPENGGTPYEVTRRLFPRYSKGQLYYCLSAATGHLELLEYLGALRCLRRDGALFYVRGQSE